MQIKLLAAAVVALIGPAGFAHAANIYSSRGFSDVPVMPINTWTGFYAGVGGGGGAVSHDIKANYEDLNAELNSLGGDGGFGTVEAGYDRQFGRFVAGIFLNYDFTSIGSKASLSVADDVAGSASYDLDSLWSAGGRFGYLVNESTLAYALGAYTQASFKSSSLLKQAGVGDKDYSGFSVGGGIETALGGPWFLKVEYRFTSLDSETLFNSDGLKVTNEPDIHQGRIVLSYKADIFGHDHIPLK